MTGARSPWRRAFVTGAGSGIGLRLAEKLLERGASVAAFDLALRGEVRERLAKLADGTRASFHEVDVRHREALERAVGEAVAAVGAPDLALHSAGVGSSKAFEALTGDEFERVVAVNLVGSRNFAAAVLPRMAPGSRLALIASLGGIVPNYGYAAYSASKFGVVGLAGVLRVEYAPRGIGVSVICPPEVETPMLAEERARGDPISLRLKQFSGTLDLEDACNEILSGLAARRWMIVPGRRARLTRHLAQHLPGLMNAIGDRMVARAIRERPTR
jgi:NAD(P)-dependent dehydrogenase (short-subunit alcohol dehydrogenase family)